MFGFSVFMNADLTTTDIDAIEEMALQGFSGIFTSMHIPEDDAASYRQRLTTLGEIAKKNRLSLMVDISGEALAKAGFSYKELNELTERGVTGLRKHSAHNRTSKSPITVKLTMY